MNTTLEASELQELRQIELEYEQFLDDSTNVGKYAQRVVDMIRSRGHRIIVSVNDMRAKCPERAARLFWDAGREIACLERALRTVVLNTDAKYAERYDNFNVGFEGNFGQRMLNPRTLKCRYLKNLVCCEGIVTKVSLIQPKVCKSVHFCPETGKIIEKRYADMTSMDALPTGATYPTEDGSGNPLETEFGLCIYRDSQTLTIQELPEIAPTGQLPRSLDILIEDDLTDRCSPGDRIRVIGVYRCLPNKQSGYTSGLFRTVVIANNIEMMSKEAEVRLTSSDIKNIKTFCRMKSRALDILARSLAPSIYGHEEVKKAILCLLLGGVEKNLASGTRLRGDINVLLIGDPSVAKSQLLRYVLNVAPRAVATTGRGSTGVGLTAAVTTDPQTRERRLEAGAMVLGDRGVVCIDEFDKMSDLDRTAIHEVLEQGRVTIVKAGIQAKLNARCAVLAAANPVFGLYDNKKTPMENIGMQDSILSRFDLLFVLLDERDNTRDMQIAMHVANVHCYRDASENPGDVLDMKQMHFGQDGEPDEADERSIYEKNTDWLPYKDEEQILTVEFLKKFICYARRITPQLSAKACEFIANKYADIRAFDESNSDKERTMPVTARLLETLIRLASAFAKIRLSGEVTVADARSAYNLLIYAIYKEKPADEAPISKRRRDGPPSPAGLIGASKQKKQKLQSGGDEDMFDFQSESGEGDSHIPMSLRGMRQSRVAAGDDVETASQASSTPTISIQRYELFRRHVRTVFDASRTMELPLDELVEGVQREAGRSAFTRDEIFCGLEKMSDENAVMVTDNTVLLI